MLPDPPTAVISALRSARRVTVLTGAGISAESGVATFRDPDGVWSRVRLEDVATPEGFARDPQAVYDFYNERRANLRKVQPNAGHRALAALERRYGEGFQLVTQNVDDLHERGGSRTVWHMHGELTKARCLGPEAHLHDWPGDLGPVDRCPRCGAGLRPHIVWFGEIPLDMDRHRLRVDAFLAVGTSGVVYPAAGYGLQARLHGALTVEINPRPSGGPFQQVLAGPAGLLLPALVDALER